MSIKLRVHLLMRWCSQGPGGRRSSLPILSNSECWSLHAGGRDGPCLCRQHARTRRASITFAWSHDRRFSHGRRVGVRGGMRRGKGRGLGMVAAGGRPRTSQHHMGAHGGTHTREAMPSTTERGAWPFFCHASNTSSKVVDPADARPRPPLRSSGTAGTPAGGAMVLAERTTVKPPELSRPRGFTQRWTRFTALSLQTPSPKCLIYSVIYTDFFLRSEWA